MSSSSLRKALRETSEKVWFELRRAKGQGRRVKEESITDLIIVSAFNDFSQNEIIIKEFSRRQEAISGADWEWVFIAKDWSKSFTMRVQAKILNPHDNTYHELHYRTKNNGYQGDILISNAERYNALPIYCLYNYFDDIDKDNFWSCPSSGSDLSIYGCALVDASKIKQLRNSSKKRLEDVSPYMLPMHCALTCSMDKSLSLPERVHRYWQNIMNNKYVESNDDLSTSDAAKFLDARNLIGNQSEEPSTANIWSDLPDVRDGIPSHIRSLLSGEMDERVAEELNISAVTIFQEAQDMDEV